MRKGGRRECTLATSGDGTNNFSYGYDRWGNRWNQTVMKGSGPKPTYAFNSNNQSGSFTYDAAGNIINDGSHTYSYDAEGRVLKVDGGGTNSYVYNSRGMRAALAGSENLFDLQGNIVSAVAPGTTTLQYNRYSVGGRLLAANSNNTTNFYHQDWLGGIRALSSLSGSLTNSCTNLPFGDGSNNCGLWNFAGLMADTWDSLNTSATRSQHPASGRWLTPDPGGLAVMDVSNPQTWNRYAYVANNPLSYTDPLGLNQCGPNCRDDGGGGIPVVGDGGSFLGGGNDANGFGWNSGPGSFGGPGNPDALPSGANGLIGAQNGWLGSGSIPWYWVQGGNLMLLVDSSSSVNEDDGVCPAGMTGCDVSGAIVQQAGWWDLGPLRAPDFVSLNVNVGIPYLLDLAGPTFSVNIGRNGHVYVGPGVNVGKGFTFVSGSATANWVTQPGQLQNFLTKNSFSFNAGWWGGVQGAWTPGSGFAGGAGFVSPQVGGAWTYSWDIGKWFGGW